MPAEIEALSQLFFLHTACRSKVVKFWNLKFIYPEKAPKFCEIFTTLLTYVVPVKSKVKISQNFVAFSEYMNFNTSVSLEEIRCFLPTH